MNSLPLKPLVIASFVLLALEVLFVISLFVSKNVGDDAAGRGMATGFGIVLGPIVLIAGALLLWGVNGGPTPAFWAGFCLVASPVFYGAFALVTGTFNKLDRAQGRAQYGRFESAALTRLARAIDAVDTVTVRQLLAESPPDWKARDRRDQTILGHAIYKAIDYSGGMEHVECVRILLEAGAPPALDVLAPERTMRSVSEHNLVFHLLAVHNPSAVAILDLVLAHGASPNQLDEDDRPMYFSTYNSTGVLDVLAKHGATFNGLDTRDDRLAWNALMNAVYLKAWPEALFYLQHGVSFDYKAPDGKSARTILAEVDPPGSTYDGPEETSHAAFIAALKK